MELIIDASIKIPIGWGVGSLQRWVSSCGYQEADAPPTPQGQKQAPALGHLPDLAIIVSSSGCSSVSFIISFHKLITVSSCVPESCEPLR